MEERPGSQEQICSLRIFSDSLLVCSNSFRQYLSKIFDLKGIYLIKTGPQRKYFQEGVIRLKSNKGLIRQFPLEIIYRGHKITLEKMDEKEADVREQESHRKMFIGGISYDTSAIDIEDYFNQFGKTAFVQLISKKNINKSTKFGFVIFEHYSTLDIVYNETPHYLNGHKVIVSDYVNNTRNRKKNQSNKREDYNTAILYSNVPSKAAFLGKLGKLKSQDWHSSKPVEKRKSKFFINPEHCSNDLESSTIKNLPTPIQIVYHTELGSVLHTEPLSIRFNIRAPKHTELGIN